MKIIFIIMDIAQADDFCDIISYFVFCEALNQIMEK